MKNEIVSSSIAKVPIMISAADTLVTIQPGKRISEPHYHDEVEFLYIFSGKLKLKTPDEEFFVSNGEIIFVSSRTVHETFFADSTYSGAIIQFKVFDYLDDFGKNIIRFLNFDEIPVYIFKKEDSKTEEIKNFLDNMILEFKTKKQGFETYIKGSIFSLLGFLMRHGFIANINFLGEFRDDERILPVIEYIDKNYTERITLDDLSKTANLSSEHLCRVFKKVYGRTLGDYINFVRVSKAEKMLSTTEKTISEVALDTGFASLSYFNRVFKKYKNCSPSVYKKIKFLAK